MSEGDEDTKVPLSTLHGYGLNCQRQREDQKELGSGHIYNIHTPESSGRRATDDDLKNV